MADDLRFSDFTTGEKLRLLGIGARALKRSLADDGSGRILADLKRKAARIEQQAERRKNKKK